MAERTTAAQEAKKGFETLLDEFDKQLYKPATGDTANKIAMGVDRLQDATYKLGLDCRCGQPKGGGFDPKKPYTPLKWNCKCKKRVRGSRRRTYLQTTVSGTGRKRKRRN